MSPPATLILFSSFIRASYYVWAKRVGHSSSLVVQTNPLPSFYLPPSLVGEGERTVDSSDKAFFSLPLDGWRHRRGGKYFQQYIYIFFHSKSAKKQRSQEESSSIKAEKKFRHTLSTLLFIYRHR